MARALDWRHEVVPTTIVVMRFGDRRAYSPGATQKIVLAIP